MSPELGEAFATGHDDSVRACLGSLLNVDVAHVPNFGQMMTNLPLHMGGLGLRSAVRLYPAAHWASWANTVAMVQERRPEVATILVENLTHHTAATSISSVQQCQRRLAGAGFDLPTWDRLVEGQRPSASDDDEASWGGWQQRASEKLERDHFSTVRAGDGALLRGSSLSRAFYLRPHQPRDTVRFRCFPGSPVASPPAPTSSVCTRVPVWPSI